VRMIASFRHIHLHIRAGFNLYTSLFILRKSKSESDASGTATETAWHPVAFI